MVMGSNGKMIVKEMIVLIFVVVVGVDVWFVMVGNLNNDVGLLLMLLCLLVVYCFVVIEIGMNYLGEIEVFVCFIVLMVVFVNNV